MAFPWPTARTGKIRCISLLGTARVLWRCVIGIAWAAGSLWASTIQGTVLRITPS